MDSPGFLARMVSRDLFYVFGKGVHVNRRCSIAALLACASLLTACGSGGTGSSVGGCSGATQSNSLQDVAYGNGIFVGVGMDVCANPLIETSTDGIAWKPRDSGDPNVDANSTDFFQQVVAGASGFVAVDDRDLVFFSKDGSNWTDITSNFGSGAHPSLSPVGWDGSQFVAIASANLQARTYVSTDGMNWTDLGVSSDATGVFTKVGGTWFGSPPSANPTHAAYFTSTDLLNWTRQSVPFAGSPYFRDIIFAGGQYIGVGSSGLVAYSSDGINWTEATLPSGLSTSYDSVAWNGSTYVAVGDFSVVLYSQDGVTWSRVDLSSLLPNDKQTVNLFLAVTARPNGAFVAVSATALNPVEITSPDGVHWSLGHP